LIKSNEELEKFAYIASHDLKAPLRAIDNLSDWIVEEIQGTLSEDGEKYVETLKGRVKRMERLINDLLHFSKVGHEAYSPEEIDVAALFKELFELQGAPEGFTLKIGDDLPSVNSYRIPLEQLFLNFISNAIKHHDDPEQGELIFDCRSKDEDYYEFSISDNGPGIPEALRNKALTMFQTLKPRDEVDGTGLGLPLIKKIIESYHGTLEIAPDIGKGCRFKFTWPKNITASEL
jgi:signal transduction histidine kinase